MKFKHPRVFPVAAPSAAWMLLAILAVQAPLLTAQSPQQHHPPGTSQPPDPWMPEKPPADGRKWTGSFAVGFSWESGVNNRLGVNLTGNALGTFGKTSALFEYGYLFAEQTFCTAEGCLDQTVANDLFGRFSLEMRFGDRLSLLSRTGYKRDTVQNLVFRVEEQLGLGIILFSNNRVFFQVAPGLVLAQEDKDLDSDDGFDSGIGTLQFFRLALNPKWTFTQSSNLQKHFDSADDFLVEGHAGLNGLITKRWAINIALLYDHENLVLEGRQKKDQKMTVGLQFNF